MSDDCEDVLATLLQDSDTETAAAVLAGMHLAKPQRIDIEGMPHLVVPNGSQVDVCENLLERPKRLKASREFIEPESFCEYIEKFNGGETARIYASYANKTFTSCLDDHQPGQPSWCDHGAKLSLIKSPELQDWMGAARGEPMDQMALAEFFEAHIKQIAEPAAADLLSGIRNIQLANNWKCASAHREGGDIEVTMSRENSASTSMGNQVNAKIPARLTLAIQPYLCWKQYPLNVMLTYRLKDEKITFTMKLLEVTEMLDQAFVDVRQMIENESGLRVFL